MSRARQTLVAVAIALSAMVLVAGCGGSSDPDSPRPLSKREYIARANELQTDAAAVFATLNGRLAATPAQAKVHVVAFDELIAGYEALRPPETWSDEHEQMLESLRTMRQSLVVVSRASAKNQRAITVQVGLYQDAQQAFERAVSDINASR